MKKTLISCIIPIYNVEKYLPEAIESVLRQTIGFKDHVQLILVNDGSPDDCSTICRKYLARFPDNIVYIEQPNAGVSKARNAGIDAADGKYIAFLDGDDMFRENYLEVGFRFLEQHFNEVDLVAFPIRFFGDLSRGSSHPLNHKFTYTRIIDIQNEYTCLQAHIASTIIKRDVLKKEQFTPNLNYAEDSELAHRIIMLRKKYGVCVESTLLYRKRQDGNSAIQSCQSKVAWYKKLLLYPRMLIESSLKNSATLPKYTQYAIMYDIQWYKLNELPKEISAQTQISELFKELAWIVQYLDDQIIKDAKFINYWQKYYLLKLKHQAKVRLDVSKDGTPTFYLDNQPFQKVFPTVWVSLVEEYNGMIHIGGYYILPKYDDLSFVANYNGKEHLCSCFHQKHRDIYFLGTAVHESRSFEFEIPYTGVGSISLHMKAPNHRYCPVKLEFTYSSRLCNKDGSFVLGKQSIIFRTSQTNVLTIHPLSKKLLDKSITTFLNRHYTANYQREQCILNKYLQMFDRCKEQEIWLFMDRQDKADDNAEHLFKYCSSIKDGVQKYFIIEKGSPDEARLKRYGNIVYYGSDEHILLTLFAKKFIAACFDFKHIFPFGSLVMPELFRSLVTSEFIFLQHGIIKADMSATLDRLTKNIKLFITSAKPEYHSIVNNPDYAYSSENVVLSGLARYDGLYDNAQKKIVFMPTWRRDLQSTAGESYQYNPNFKHSEYCKTISSLLSDKRLIAVLQKHEYEFVFRPHPVVYQQIGDFKTSPHVKITPYEESYQNTFAEASLVITDFSSAVFDFAYLKKPVIYYQFGKQNFVDGYFNSKTMGFGEVVTKQEDLIDLLIRYMEHGCHMSNHYKKRVNKFFAYNDRNNCSRIYNYLKP